jgi:hypothetical protein
MPRVRGLERNEAPLSLRWAYGYVRKLFGKELTPVKVTARVPAVFWASSLVDTILRRSRRVDERLKALAEMRAASRVGCPF